MYDTNIVHIISNVAENVQWTSTNNKFYSKTDKKTVDMQFHHLNVIHMYNFGMISVDVADQLCIQNRPDCVGGKYFFGDLGELRQLHTS